MKRIAATKFKEQCLSILDSLAHGGVLITKHGKPVAKLVPVCSEFGGLIGARKGKLKINGNIISTSLRWDAQS